MKVSVIIPVKNPGNIFHKVLPAVLNQNTPWDYDVILVDSGSTDSTMEYIEKIQKTDARLRLYRIKSEEFGHGKTRNFAIAQSKSEFVAMITHDAQPVNEHWLYNLVSAVERRSDIAGAFGRHMAYPHAGSLVKRDMELHFANFNVENPIFVMEDNERYEKDQAYRMYLHFFSDNNSCLRRLVWENIPYADVNFGEDQLWAHNIIKAGYAKSYAHDAAVYHSHDYGIIESFRRQFDESSFYYKTFGYQLVPRLRTIVSSVARQTKNDWRHLQAARELKNNLRSVMMSPLLNLASLSGRYLGCQKLCANYKLLKSISLDAENRSR